jgi:hypothetical protein
MATLMKSKKEVKWQGSILMQAQIEKVFIFLGYRNTILLRECDG